MSVEKGNKADKVRQQLEADARRAQLQEGVNLNAALVAMQCAYIIMRQLYYQDRENVELLYRAQALSSIATALLCNGAQRQPVFDKADIVRYWNAVHSLSHDVYYEMVFHALEGRPEQLMRKDIDVFFRLHSRLTS